MSNKFRIKKVQKAAKQIGKYAQDGESDQEVDSSISGIYDSVVDKVTDMLDSKIKKYSKKVIKKVVKQVLKKALPKFMAKSASKKIPVAGAALSAVYACKKLFCWDWSGAAMELASGAASCIPGAGTAASAAIDIGLLVKEIYDEVYYELERQ